MAHNNHPVEHEPIYARDNRNRAAKGMDLGSVGPAAGTRMEPEPGESENALDTREVADTVRRHLEPEI